MMGFGENTTEIIKSLSPSSHHTVDENINEIRTFNPLTECQGHFLISIDLLLKRASLPTSTQS